jgi:two-component system response regulator RegA
MKQTYLIIDDDVIFNAVLVRALERRGHTVRGVTAATEAVAAAKALQPSHVVLDLNINGVSGLPLIPSLLIAAPDCRIVVLTGYASIVTAVEAIKLGAMQYLAKPIEVEAIIAAFAENNEHESDDTAALVASDPMSVNRLEWEHIQRVLHENDSNISATARALKMHRRTLQRKLAKRPVKH